MIAVELKNDIIIPTLSKMDGNYLSNSAVNLILGTFAQESHLGRWRTQVGGYALGLGQGEESTFDWLKKKYPDFLSDYKFEDLQDNDKLSTMFCRLRYAVVVEPLPAEDDVEGMARYWKEYYNTALGKGTESQFIRNYGRFIV